MEIEVAEPWFSLIRVGAKTTEGRKGTPKWAAVRAGDRVVFTHRGERVRARVVDVVHYGAPNALDKYLRGETLRRALPGVRTYAEGRAVYLGFWDEADVEKWGMLALRVEVD